jgi:nitroreductase
MGDAVDCMIAATYAMLAAESMGLGSCMLGTSVALTRDQRLKARYGIPPENKVGVTLVIGYFSVKFRHALRRRFGWLSYVDETCPTASSKCPMVDGGASGPQCRSS